MDAVGTVLTGRVLGTTVVDAEGRTTLRLVGGGWLHVRNASLVGTSCVTGGRVARAERAPGRLSLHFSNGHHLDIPVADGPGAVLVRAADGTPLYAEA
jgi:hypothetical protein